MAAKEPAKGVGGGGRPRSWGGGGTSSELPAQSQPCRTQLGPQGPEGGRGRLTPERSSVWGLQGPQGRCGSHDTGLNPSCSSVLGGSWGGPEGVLGSFSPPSPGSTPSSASPTLPNPGLLSAQPKLQQRWPRMGAWSSGRKGGQAVGFPPAAGEPERVHQQACSHGEEKTC